jgi:hypothetical protein
MTQCRAYCALSVTSLDSVIFIFPVVVVFVALHRALRATSLYVCILGFNMLARNVGRSLTRGGMFASDMGPVLGRLEVTFVVVRVHVYPNI